eukprot:gb/GECH01003580.1/.p1 GENE.gb/GECH01003580.1/~~gb/GECH01003580.1/.p1  ORF type:complete len:519 (+),score=116.11 gb/GECH01003580.1/:1-1557(+)
MNAFVKQTVQEYENCLSKESVSMGLIDQTNRNEYVFNSTPEDSSTDSESNHSEDINPYIDNSDHYHGLNKNNNIDENKKSTNEENHSKNKKHHPNSPSSYRQLHETINQNALLEILRDNPLHALMVAAYQGDIDTIHLLKDHDLIDIRVATDLKTGATAAHKAAASNHIDILTLLLNEGISPLATDNVLTTPLHQAAANNHIEAVCFLASRAKTIEVTDTYGYTPLHAAVKSNALDTVKYLHELFHASIITRNSVGKTPLITASEFRYMDIVDYFLSLPSTGLELQDNLGNTALTQAVTFGNIEILNRLINHGANVWTWDELGKNILHKAAENGQVEALEILDENNPDCVMDQLNCLDTENNATPLHLAVEKHYFKTAAQLISMGANVNRSDGFGCTPLQLALQNEDDEICKLLQSYGAKTKKGALVGIARRIKNLGRKERKHLVGKLLPTSQYQPEPIPLPSPNSSKGSDRSIGRFYKKMKPTGKRSRSSSANGSMNSDENRSSTSSFPGSIDDNTL